MARSKRSPTLLEVIGRQGKPGSEGFHAPTWWKSPPPPGAAAGPFAEDPAASSAEADRGRRTIQLGRFRIPLTPASAVVAIGGLAIVVFAAWQISSLSGRNQRQSVLLPAGHGPSIDQIREQPPRSDALDVLLGRVGDPVPAGEATLASADLPLDTTRSPQPAAPPSTAAVARQPGLNYVVVETFRAPDASAEAQDARNFLLIKGIRTTLERMGANLCLVTERGFPAGDPQMKAYCRNIEELGQEYFASGGKYRFRGCYGKLYRSNGW